MQCLHITYMAIYTLLGFKTLNQNTYTVGEQLQSHLSGLNYSTPVNYSFRKICSNHTSIAWFAIQEESSPFSTGDESTPQLLLLMTLQHVSSSIPAPESAFSQAQDLFILSFTKTMRNMQQLSWLSVHVPLFYFTLSYAITERSEKAPSGSGFLLVACKRKGYFHHIKPACVNGCIKLRNF